MSEEQGTEKPHEATPRKLEEARRKGEIPRASDLTVAVSYMAMAAAAITFGGASLRGLAETGAMLIDQSDRLAILMSRDAAALTGGLLGTVGRDVAIWFVAPACAVLGSLLALRGLVFAPSKLEPKLSRISLVANARNKFGTDGLFEFAKSATKLVVVGALVWLYLLARLPAMLETMYLSAGQIAGALCRMLLEFMFLVTGIAALIGVVDFLWQRHSHARRQRMSHQELREDFKQSEGDPHMKQQRRRRGEAIATSRMLSDVAKASVVIVNPQHYAVALQWNRASGRAPVCVAKGTDEIAARIRERAVEGGIPIRRDPPTARALHAVLRIGDEVLPEHYKPVAAAIRFAEAMQRKARQP